MKKTFPALSLSLAALVVIASTAAAGPIKFARTPHIAHGKIAFSYHGDIWIAEADGSGPRRLTAHVAADMSPRFSPDGRRIAFTSDRMGNSDVYVVPVEGGEPTQLTFMTGADSALYWTPDGQGVLFATGRGERAWGSPLHTVPVKGGLPVPLPMDQAALGMISQDGKKIAFNRIAPRYWRKGYRGNASAELYVMDADGKNTLQLTNTKLEDFRSFRQDYMPMWGADGMIYFLSERDGFFNIWRVTPAGGEPVQVTFHEKDGVQFPSISPDGTEIIYECEFDLWKMKVPDGRPERIPLDLAFDPKANLVEYLAVDGRADGFVPSPKGDYLAVDYHGEIFVVPAEEGIGEMRQITSSPWRERYQSYSPDGKHLAYVSDESLEEEIWLYTLETGQRKKLTAHASAKGPFVWSPDSKRIAFSAANTLFLIDVGAGSVRELDERPGGHALAGFSPDGQWLVMTLRDEDANADVHLFNIAERKAYDVTPCPFRDMGGELTPDGKHLVFLSNRSDGVTHLFKVALAARAEDPDDPLVKERLRKAEEKRAKEKEAATAAPAPLRVDLEGIDRRAVPVTTGTHGVNNLFFLSKDGKTAYFLSADDKGPGIFSIGLDGKDRKKIAEGTFGDLQVTEDRKTVFFRQQEGVFRMDLGGKDKKKVGFRFKVVVDRRPEFEQIFEECWRVMKYRFYDPDMHGTDWEAVRETYKPLLAYAGDYQDVYDIVNEAIGELNASHTGVSGPPGPERTESPAGPETRYLGFELAPDRGFYRIAHIYRDGPADKEWLKLKKGDYVFAIDGREIKAGDNYWPILGHLLNEYVTVKVGAGPDPGAAGVREVRVRSVDSLRDIKYQEWVKGNREIVDEKTGAQIAYVHIRSMNQPSLRVFENEITQFSNKKGIIVDIRYNGGGNIDQQILDILERRPYEYWNSRWGARSWGRRPQQAIAGPKVMLINWRSASDSEVTPMGFRDLGLGRIVGNPTNASVIATGSYRLINGGSIRTPGSLVVTYDPTKPDNYGINLENYGVAPDVFVKNSPQDEFDGFDRELDTAIKEVLRMLKEGVWQYRK
ncbi:MAG: S41 family peptidase [Candidatus Aminicenantes bacterium]